MLMHTSEMTCKCIVNGVAYTKLRSEVCVCVWCRGYLLSGPDAAKGEIQPTSQILTSEKERRAVRYVRFPGGPPPEY